MSDADEPPATRRRSAAPGGEPWDDSEWVDVGRNDQWSPSVEERSRALIVLAVLGGILALAAGVASFGGGGEDETATGPSSSSSTTAAAVTLATPSTTTTTAPPDPASLDGEDPPDACVDDGRDALPLRPPSQATVQVLNATSTNGLAGDKTAELEGLGYPSVPPANDGSRDTTLIQYQPGYCAEAVTLAENLGAPDLTVEALAAGSEGASGQALLVVTVGRDLS